MRTKQLAASIVCADQLNLEQELKKLKEVGITHLHCDVMDGIFVDNLSMSPELIEAIRRIPGFTYDIHLATVNPRVYIEMFEKLNPEYLTFHYETTKAVDETIQLVKSFGIKVGIAINPETDWEVLKPYLNDIDLVLMMTVNPGFKGQTFQTNVLKKIAELNSYLTTISNQVLIEVDGNIYKDTIRSIMAHGGADLFVLGTAGLFKRNEDNYDDKVGELLSVLK